MPTRCSRLWLLAGVLACAAEEPPASAPALPDIFVATLRETEGTVAIGDLANVTNRPGYDNQPHFTPTGTALWYTSQRNEQTDIYRYDLTTGDITQVTATPESEYSATPVPGSDAFSVVRVEADSSQRLWRFDADSTPPTLIIADVQPVGYQAWADAATVGVFVLGSPPTLQIVDLTSGTATTVAQDIGRSLHPIPGRRALSFVHKVAADEWWIMELDPETGGTERLVRTLPGQEDHAWTPAGTMLMGRGSELHAWRWGASDWTLVDDLTTGGLREISRLAVSPDGSRIAVVAVPD